MTATKDKAVSMEGTAICSSYQNWSQVIITPPARLNRANYLSTRTKTLVSRIRNSVALVDGILAKFGSGELGNRDARARFCVTFVRSCPIGTRRAPKR